MWKTHEFLCNVSLKKYIYQNRIKSNINDLGQSPALRASWAVTHTVHIAAVVLGFFEGFYRKLRARPTGSDKQNANLVATQVKKNTRDATNSSDRSIALSVVARLQEMSNNGSLLYITMVRYKLNQVSYANANIVQINRKKIR